MAEQKEEDQQWEILARQVGETHGADVLLFSGRIDEENVDEFINVVKRAKRRANVFLMLTTRGGSPDAAFRMARCLQRMYTKFTLCVYGRCKSAGTLIAVGAHELVLADFGELGPLDVQLGKNDEIFEEVSGLNITQALNSLNTRTHAFFTEVLVTIRQGSRAQVSTKLAAEIATGLAVGTYGKIFSQVDPGQLGAIERAIHIASDYGDRLKSTNVKQGTIDKLISGYSTHGFVIDLQEAKSLFNVVRETDKIEEDLGECIAHVTRDQTDKSLVLLLNPWREPKNETQPTDSDSGAKGEEPGGGTHNQTAVEASGSTRPRPKVVAGTDAEPPTDGAQGPVTHDSVSAGAN